MNVCFYHVYGDDDRNQMFLLFRFHGAFCPRAVYHSGDIRSIIILQSACGSVSDLLVVGMTRFAFSLQSQEVYLALRQKSRVNDGEVSCLSLRRS